MMIMMMRMMIYLIDDDLYDDQMVGVFYFCYHQSR